MCEPCTASKEDESGVTEGYSGVFVASVGEIHVILIETHAFIHSQPLTWDGGGGGG